MHSIQLINTCRALSVKNITSFIQRQEAWCLKTSKPLLSPQETYGINKKPWELYKQLFCKGKYVLRYSTGCSSHAPGASSAIWTAQPLLHQLANIQCWPAGKSLSSAPGCFTVYHHFSPVSPLPKSTVSSPPTNLTAFTWDLLFVAIPSKACWEVSVSYCGGIFWKTNSSSVFSAYSGLITSGDSVFCEWDEKKSIYLLHRGLCLVSIIKNLCMKKSKTPKLVKVFIERIQLRLQKKCGKTPELMLFMQPYFSQQRDVSYTAVFIHMMRSCTLWCRRINMNKDFLYLEGVSWTHPDLF